MSSHCLYKIRRVKRHIQTSMAITLEKNMGEGDFCWHMTRNMITFTIHAQYIDAIMRQCVCSLYEEDLCKHISSRDYCGCMSLHV